MHNSAIKNFKFFDENHLRLNGMKLIWSRIYFCLHCAWVNAAQVAKCDRIFNDLLGHLKSSYNSWMHIFRILKFWNKLWMTYYTFKGLSQKDTGQNSILSSFYSVREESPTPESWSGAWRPIDTRAHTCIHVWTVRT